MKADRRAPERAGRGSRLRHRKRRTSSSKRSTLPRMTAWASDLSVSRTIIESHHGRLWASTQRRSRSRLFLSLFLAGGNLVGRARRPVSPLGCLSGRMRHENQYQEDRSGVHVIFTKRKSERRGRSGHSFPSNHSPILIHYVFCSFKSLNVDSNPGPLGAAHIIPTSTGRFGGKYPIRTEVN